MFAFVVGLVVGAVAGFLFAKNNKNKAAEITDKANELRSKAKF
jgi:uncharacterized membrane-anchored protein YhcB (DUF1043 family)